MGLVEGTNHSQCLEGQAMRSISRPVDIFQQSSQPVSKEVLVPVERALHLRVNDKLAAVLMRQPGNDLELAVGYCFTEGLATNTAALLSVQHCEEEVNTVNVLIAGSPPAQPRRIGTECTGADQMVGELPAPLDIDSDMTWPAHQLLNMSVQFRAHQRQHKLSGGVHGAALFDRDGKLVVLREDIGRYNAMDKAVGYSVLHDLPLTAMALMVSGRASSNMVLKAVRARIPLLATMSHTTSLGWKLADHLGLTLVTYLRGKSFRICCHSVRIAQMTTPS